MKKLTLFFLLLAGCAKSALYNDHPDNGRLYNPEIGTSVPPGQVKLGYGKTSLLFTSGPVGPGYQPACVASWDSLHTHILYYSFRALTATWDAMIVFKLKTDSIQEGVYDLGSDSGTVLLYDRYGRQISWANPLYMLIDSYQYGMISGELVGTVYDNNAGSILPVNGSFFYIPVTK